MPGRRPGQQDPALELTWLHGCCGLHLLLHPVGPSLPHKLQENSVEILEAE